MEFWQWPPNADMIWLMIGFGGQFIFGARFLVQWISSERKRESVMPIAFWYLSLLGGMTLLSYAVYKRDPVFMMGQSFGLVVYIRNLYLIHMHRKKNSDDLE